MRREASKNKSRTQFVFYSAYIFAYFFAFLLLWSPQSGAAQPFTGYLAASTLYEFPGAARLGYKAWEAGLLQPAVVGFDKVIPIGRVLYAALGPVATFQGKTSFGFWAGFGFNYHLFWFLKLRGELSAVQSVNGYSNGRITLGLAF